MRCPLAWVPEAQTHSTLQSIEEIIGLRLLVSCVTCHIYNAVRESGLPNYLGIRKQLTTSLNIDRWDAVFGQYPEFEEMVGIIKYGFPMGYMGPTSELDCNYNHSSATAYKSHIDSFIEKEQALGGVIGPFDKPPFSPWVHCAPLMSRPKSDTDSRRIISD